MCPCVVHGQAIGRSLNQQMKRRETKRLLMCSLYKKGMIPKPGR